MWRDTNGGSSTESLSIHQEGTDECGDSSPRSGCEESDEESETDMTPEQKVESERLASLLEEWQDYTSDEKLQKDLSDTATLLRTLVKDA
jgi:hypothetical protein